MNAKLKCRVLSEWMGFNRPSQEPLQPSNLKTVFHKAFTRLGLKARFQETTLQENWCAMVGPALAAHCHPGGIRRGILCVLVDHPAWLHQIALAHKADILHALQEYFPHLKIKDLVLRIG